jgi:hypothetical protein
MTKLTREVLIKTIVADEMRLCDGFEYTKHLKSLYHKWEHESSEVLCTKYNQLNSTNISVDSLIP